VDCIAEIHVTVSACPRMRAGAAGARIEVRKEHAVAIPVKHRAGEDVRPARPQLRLVTPVEEEPAEPVAEREPPEERSARVARRYLVAYVAGAALFLGLTAAVMAGASAWSWWPAIPLAALLVFASVCVWVARRTSGS
jgi:hypothetical protein